MRVASAAEIESFLDASCAPDADRIVPLVPTAPRARRLRGISPDEVIRTTTQYLEQWLPTINLAEVRALLERLDIGIAIMPDPSIHAGYSADSGIIGIHRGLIEFLRHRSALLVMTAFLERLKRLATRSKAVDPGTLARSSKTLDKVLESLETKTFDFILKNCVEADPLGGLLSSEMASPRDVIFNGILTFTILHEYGHAVIRKNPRPDFPPRFDENLDFPIREEVRLTQYEEHMADALACQIVPDYSVPWLISAATVFFGTHIVFEDLCYENRADHPRAANRIALLLHYTDLPDRYKDECRTMADLGKAVASKRLQMRRENEPLADRRKRAERYVQAHNPEVDPISLIAALSAVPSLEAEVDAQASQLFVSEKVSG